MPRQIRAVPLEAAGVRLEPLEDAHREGLRAAAVAPQIWTRMPHLPAASAFDPWFDAALKVCAAGMEAVWVVRGPDGSVVGSTRYLVIEADHRRVEIGHTWYSPAVWGGVVNPACKYALLRHGFDTLGLNRIEIKTDIIETDIRNLRSQAAIAKLGAVREGVFRAHMVCPDGSLRDTVYFSINRAEWPEIRDRLTARLAALTNYRDSISLPGAVP